MQQTDWLHVELTTRCNAWCPSCPRNQNGYGLSDFDVLDLSLDRLQDVVTNTKCSTVQLCGNLGDPLAAKNLDQHLDYLISCKLKKIQIHTNGSLRSVEWWKDLAHKLTDHEVFFALDGIQDVHEYYRQGTSYQKVIENSTAFIEAGGKATWQFIPFKHNEHQIKECLVLSQKLGFDRFEFVKNARYSDESFHYKTNEPLNITGWNKDDMFSTKNRSNNYVDESNCMHLSYPSLYLTASGNLSPCCYMPEIDIDDFEGIVYPKCLRICGSDKP